MFHSYTRACKLAPAACSAAHMLSVCRGEKLEAWHLNSDGLWIRSALRNKSQVKNSEQAEILKEQALMFKASTLARGHVRVDVCWGVGEWGGVSYIITFICTSAHTSCYATVRSLALSHIRHATLLWRKTDTGNVLNKLRELCGWKIGPSFCKKDRDQEVTVSLW